MSTLRAFLLVVFLCAAPMKAFAEKPSFDGYMITASKPLFLLSVDGKKSDWVPLGSTFEGFSIVGFDPKDESLVVNKSGMRQNLPLRQSGILAKASSPDEDIQTLKGLALGYALARRGDKELIRLIGIHQESIAARENGKEGAPVEFFKAKIESVAQERRNSLPDTK